MELLLLEVSAFLALALHTGAELLHTLPVDLGILAAGLGSGSASDGEPALVEKQMDFWGDQVELELGKDLKLTIHSHLDGPSQPGQRNHLDTFALLFFFTLV